MLVFEARDRKLDEEERGRGDRKLMGRRTGASVSGQVKRECVAVY